MNVVARVVFMARTILLAARNINAGHGSLTQYKFTRINVKFHHTDIMLEKNSPVSGSVSTNASVRPVSYTHLTLPTKRIV